jgi:hypothetical protein
MDLHQGQWPLEPFILVGEWERAGDAVDTSQLALSHSNGRIAKGLALCRRSGRQSLLVGSWAKPRHFLGSSDRCGHHRGRRQCTRHHRDDVAHHSRLRADNRSAPA